MYNRFRSTVANILSFSWTHRDNKHDTITHVSSFNCKHALHYTPVTTLVSHFMNIHSSSPTVLHSTIWIPVISIPNLEYQHQLEHNSNPNTFHLGCIFIEQYLFMKQLNRIWCRIVVAIVDIYEKMIPYFVTYNDKFLQYLLGK